MVVAGETATSTSTTKTILTEIILTAARQEIIGSIIRTIAGALPMAIEGPPINLEAEPVASGRPLAIVPAVEDWGAGTAVVGVA